MADSLNAIERKEIAKLAETCGYKSTHCTFAPEFCILVFRSVNTSPLARSLHVAVNRLETEKLLHEYRRMTSKTLDRSTFRDLLHGTLGMTDDFFMDRGR